MGQPPGVAERVPNTAAGLPADVDERREGAARQPFGEIAVGDRRSRLRIAEDMISAIAGDEGVSADLARDRVMDPLEGKRLEAILRSRQVRGDGLVEVDVFDAVLAF